MPLKFNNPSTIRATYRIVTPMFIGDAEQKATGISPSSVKGALRFWWRALNWGRFRTDSDNDDQALKRLHEAEGALFGSPADNGRAASFTLRVEHKLLTSTEVNVEHDNFKTEPQARYLAYGLMEAFPNSNKGTKAGQLWRECINEGQVFTVVITSRDSTDESLEQSLIALGTLGGLGGRVRRGMGSLALEKLQKDENIIFSSFKSIDEYQSFVGELTSNLSGVQEPPFSAFSSVSRVDILEKGSDPYKVLSALGDKMLMYRSWGRTIKNDPEKRSKVLHKYSEQRFKEDHDWKYKKHAKGFHPRRVMFGLPHNYDKHPSLWVTPEKHPLPTPRDVFKHDRRASPLAFHVHKVGSIFIGVSLLFRSKFLPNGEKINAGGKNVPANIDWSVLTDFLDGKDKKGNVRFPKVES